MKGKFLSDGSKISSLRDPAHLELPKVEEMSDIDESEFSYDSEYYVESYHEGEVD